MGRHESSGNGRGAAARFSRFVHQEVSGALGKARD